MFFAKSIGGPSKTKRNIASTDQNAKAAILDLRVLLVSADMIQYP